ncbi:MAG: hypothetical protein Q8O84_03350 [Nanoarchaeota archaeon]|nr:hypothetical protein [Nanoarchaeota archaeon]
MLQPQQDHLQVKEKIISFIGMRGPSLPVHIGKEINTSILFTSAFLSELVSEKRLKISNLNVGNSHLYFIPGSEPLLEGFSQHLKSKEKEAFELLKQKRVLKDSEQHPAIRVAIREIKDFAIPFKKDDQLYWKYLMVSDQELINKIKDLPAIREVKKQFGPNGVSSGEAEKKEPIISEQIIFSKKEKPEEKETIKDKKKIIKKENRPSVVGLKKKIPQKKGDKFFNKVKEFLSKSQIEILDIEDASKDNLVLRIKINNKEKLLVAYNKKKIDESDIIKAYKKSSELALEYMILSLGEPSKKLNEFIEAVKGLDGIEKIE